MTTEHWFKSRLRQLDGQECWELLANHRVGRIVFTDDYGPTALPVNYSVDGEDLLIATSAYGPIARAVEGSRVAFEVDDIDPLNESGWSVVVQGRASQAMYLDLPVDPGDRPYPWAEGTRNHVIRIHPTHVSGRRLIPT